MAATNLIKGRAGLIGLATSSSQAATAPIGGYRNVVINRTRESIVIRDRDSSGHTERKSGFGDWTATFNCSLLSTNAPQAQNTFRTILSSGTRAYYYFQNSTSTGDKAWTAQGWGYAVGWSWNGDVNDVWLHDFSVEGDGPLTVS